MTAKNWICPSILSADFAQLGADVAAVVAAGADRIHIDVMDNHYVPNLTFGPVVVKALQKYGITTPMDVHLMVEPVDALIDSFIQLNVASIVFHPEASLHPHRSLMKIKEAGIECGLALNPATGLEALEHLYGDIDRVLLMSVNPGFAAQSFISSVLDKAKALKARIAQEQKNILIEIDGGVHKGNIAEIAASGVEAFVAGSAIFSHDQKDYGQVIAAMKEALS